MGCFKHFADFDYMKIKWLASSQRFKEEIKHQVKIEPVNKGSKNDKVELLEDRGKCLQRKEKYLKPCPFIFISRMNEYVCKKTLLKLSQNLKKDILYYLIFSPQI